MLSGSGCPVRLAAFVHRFIRGGGFISLFTDAVEVFGCDESRPAPTEEDWMLSGRI